MQHLLIALHGPVGAGKTYFIRYLMRAHPDRVTPIRSPTERAPREDWESAFFDFLSKAEFDRGLADGSIVPSGVFRDKRYGIYLPHTRELLETRHGIIALTDAGIRAFRQDAGIEERLRVVECAASSRTLLENLHARWSDPQRVRADFDRAMTYRPYPGPHASLFLRGTHNDLAALAADLFRQLGI